MINLTRLFCTGSASCGHLSCSRRLQCSIIWFQCSTTLRQLQGIRVCVGILLGLFALPCRSLQDVFNHLGSQGYRLSHKVQRMWPLLLTAVVDTGHPLCIRTNILSAGGLGL